MRQCNHYSFIFDSPFSGIIEKWDYYYDVDRCIFVQAELRNLQTYRLLNISKVVKADSIPLEYFEKFWVSPPTDSILEPLI